MKTAKDILDFWFGASPTPSEEKIKSWYEPAPELDKFIQKQFESLLLLVKQGSLSSWQKEPLERLALIILCDQFPRNIYRQAKEAFMYDPIALKNSKQGIKKGQDRFLNGYQKLFFYMPLMHSEDMDTQEFSLKQFSKLAQENEFFEETFDYAQRHYKIIKDFGRYPYRNQVLARKTTKEEETYLKTADTFGQ